MRRIRIRTRRPKAFALTAGVLVAALMPAGAQATPSETSSAWQRPAEIAMKVSGWCDNRGSDITLDGEIRLGSAAMKITLSNNVKGTHSVEAQMSGDVVVKPAQANTVVQKAPPLGGVGGNPHAILELRDTAGTVVGTWYLGRCVSGGGGSKNAWSANITKKFGLAGGFASWVGAVECSQKGSRLQVKGAAWNKGLDAKIILANQVNKDPGEPGVWYAEVAATVTVNLLPEINRKKGWWDKEAGIHGPGGNPLVYKRLADSAGAYPGYDLKTESTWGDALGRCNKLI